MSKNAEKVSAETPMRDAVELVFDILENRLNGNFSDQMGNDDESLSYAVEALGDVITNWRKDTDHVG